MSPYLVSKLFPWPFRTSCRFRRSHKCTQTLRLYRFTYLVFPITAFPAVFGMAISIRLLSAHPATSSLIREFFHIPALPFPIQNT